MMVVRQVNYILATVMTALQHRDRGRGDIDNIQSNTFSVCVAGLVPHLVVLVTTESINNGAGSKAEELQFKHIILTHYWPWCGQDATGTQPTSVYIAIHIEVNMSQITDVG